MFRKKTYVITGEVPRVQIDEKFIVSEDGYNYCVREDKYDNISIVSKSLCHSDLLSAFNHALQLIQKDL